MKKIWLFLLILLLVGCFNEKNKLNLNVSSNINLLDGQKSNNPAEKIVLQHIFVGLTVEDEKGKIIPAVAEKWEVSGTTWTFTINSNAKWENGKKVKAQDFVTAWERVISPLNNNENAQKMFMIKNAKEYNQSKVNFEGVGIKAVDENTLVVELVEENPYFDRVVAQGLFYPVNTEFYKKTKGKYGIGKKNILGNGAYKISSWKDGKALELIKSKKYSNKEKIKINKLNFLISGDSKNLKELYENEKIQVLNLSPEEIFNYKDNKNFHTGALNFIQFNLNEKLFSNKKIRKAIAMSIDRNKFINNFMYGLADEAEALIPKGVSGKEKDFREEYNQKNYEVFYDNNKAKLLFHEGLQELGMSSNDIKNISLLVRSTEQEIAMGNFIKNQLRENLDLNISVESETAQMREQIINSRAYSFTLDTFGSELSEALVYLSNWTSNNYSNLTNWGKSEFDSLIEMALKEKDFSKRVELIHQAEKLLMEELPIIPLAFSKKTYVIKENVKNVRLSNLSGELDFRYASIEKK